MGKRKKEFKVGDLVKVKWLADQVYIGVLTEIEKRRELFSDKFSVVTEATYLHILTENQVEIVNNEDCIVQVLNEI